MTNLATNLADAAGQFPNRPAVVLDEDTLTSQLRPEQSENTMNFNVTRRPRV